MKIIYRLLNLRNIEFETYYLKVLQSENYLLIGIEVTNSELQNFLHFNIDPQHEIFPQNISCIEKILELKDELYTLKQNFEKICIITIRPDSDSIGSFALLDLIFNNQLKNKNDILINTKRIGSYDQHGRDNWKENIKPIFSLPPSLLTMIADHTLNISEKVSNVKQFLLTGKFKTYNFYSDIAYKKNKIAIDKTNIDIIIQKKLAYVESSYRGAISKGYKYCPVVIAKNPHYIFGLGNNKINGIKYTIAQYNENYIDLNKILNRILELETGWGGSKTIIGSPQDRSSVLTKTDIIDIMKDNYGR
jgi:hypothetical protein